MADDREIILYEVYPGGPSYSGRSKKEAQAKYLIDHNRKLEQDRKYPSQVDGKSRLPDNLRQPYGEDVSGIVAHDRAQMEKIDAIQS